MSHLDGKELDGSYEVEKVTYFGHRIDKEKHLFTISSQSTPVAEDFVKGVVGLLRGGVNQ
jgi:hypothetical protein